MKMLKKLKKYIRNNIKKEYSIDDYRDYGATIGTNCKIYSSNIDIGHAYLITIGNNCTLTHCTILAHDASTQIYFKKSKVGIVKIGDNTFVGWGSIILPNVSIGKNCIIGAGSVVSKDIPDNSIVIGNPCKIVSNIDEFIKKNEDAMKNKPVFNTYWKNKTEAEKQKEKKLLANTFGYDE